jgi:hypothetical protein
LIQFFKNGRDYGKTIIYEQELSFERYKYYNDLVKTKIDESNKSTFKNFNQEITTGNYQKNKFFLTNALLGLREGNKNKGPFLQSLNAEYLLICKKFLEFEIDTIKPKAIITLGAMSYQFLVNNFITGEKHYPVIKTFKEFIPFYTKNDSYCKVEILGLNMTLIPISHTSLEVNVGLTRAFLNESLNKIL